MLRPPARALTIIPQSPNPAIGAVAVLPDSSCGDGNLLRQLPSKWTHETQPPLHAT